MLKLEEYVEQAYLFRVIGERLPESLPLQELLTQVREELLTTTKLPMAVDFLLSELRHLGVFGSAMVRLPHYFTSFQTYIVREAESDRGRFEIRVAFEILRHQAEFLAKKEVSPQGVFLYQFETLCRNRLSYDYGLKAMSEDPIYDDHWREWILTLRHQIGLVDLADMVYVRSQHYLNRKMPAGDSPPPPEKPTLFGEKEGKIALANRQKDPLYLFAALQRHLGYPRVPRPKRIDQSPQRIPQLMRRVEQLETRIKLIEEEQRNGIDITQFYRGPLPSEPSDG